MARLVILLASICVLAVAGATSAASSMSYLARLGSSHGAARLTVGTPNSLYVNAKALATGSWAEAIYVGTCTHLSTRIVALPALVVGAGGRIARTNSLTPSQARSARGGVIRLAHGTTSVCGPFAVTSAPSPSPTPSPTPTPDPSAGTVLLDVSGRGTSTTSRMAVPANWEIDYVYDCTAIGVPGSFSITVDRGGGLSDTPISEAGNGGGDAVVQRNRRGSVSLQINSSCDWEVIVVAD